MNEVIKYYNLLFIYLFMKLLDKIRVLKIKEAYDQNI